MIYTERLKSNISELRVILNDLITSAESQGGKNLQTAYSLSDGLEELSENINSNKDLNIQFIKKWNNVVAHSNRFFEGHPILNLINSIDKDIVPENMRFFM